MQGRLKREDGAVTVEATISLTAFMFAIVTILSIVNICMVQARMAVAINTTAREISQYSYLYSLTGLQGSQAQLKANGEQNTENVDQILSDINTVFNEVEKLGNGSEVSVDSTKEISQSWENIVGSVNTIKGAGSSLEDSISSIAKNPKEVMFGIVKLVASDAMDEATSKLIAAPLSKAMCKKHLLDAEDSQVEDYLKHLGVVANANGKYMDGLDFSQSTLFPGGSNDITISVKYDVQAVPVLPLDLTFTFRQTAHTYGWLSGDASFK